ncbi:DUF3127 domain-containing protein [uncultured Duncaniella sp.]|jgi:hypothetical protein|uniref:DUF3127 domain-containing protein n=1 Tax=uncultured Duncaniella sp. TaxID=2768039 RepID=UPI0026765E79|nr:DUF3127 domain-containing protein [uncultured Duncaniella sp.]
MANCIIGQILAIGGTQTLTSNNGNSFTKRTLVVSVRRFDPNTGEPVNDYENTPEFSFIGDRCRDLDQFQVGQNVCVYFNLVGTRYTPTGGQEKIINDVRPYKIELYGKATQPSEQNQAASGYAAPAPTPPAQTMQPAQATPQQQAPGYNPPF